MSTPIVDKAEYQLQVSIMGGGGGGGDRRIAKLGTATTLGRSDSNTHYIVSAELARILEEHCNAMAQALGYLQRETNMDNWSKAYFNWQQFVKEHT